MAVKRYDGSQWVTVAGKGDQGTSSSIATWVKTATGGETSVSGNDDNSQPLSYTVGQELVFINGALQKRGSDYTATTGNSITGLTALAANDVVTVWTVNAFSVTGAIANSLVDAKGDLIVATGADTPGILTAGTTGQVLTVDSTTGTGLKWATPGSGFVGCTAYKVTTAQSLSNATDAVITFNDEEFDTDGFHSTSTNTSRMTIPAGKGGKYLCIANIAFAANATGTRQVKISKNGATAIGGVYTMANTVSGEVTYMSVSGIVDCAVSDYLEVTCYQSSGGSLNVNAGQSNTRFSIQYLGA